MRSMILLPSDYKIGPRENLQINYLLFFDKQKGRVGMISSWINISEVYEEIIFEIWTTNGLLLKI